MPYYEPFDIEEYYKNALWVNVLKHVCRSFIGFTWIVALYCAIATCLTFWKMLRQ